ncbi:ATP-binding protein [Candidatus Gottesmanbacteria bacterium]|nr:ATP-binding protein [Candidatus Gottesmanbacteria bacterium]
MNDFSKYFRREIEDNIKVWLNEGYVVAIIGARQTGKTTLLKNLQEKEKALSFYYLFDDPILREKVSSDFYFLKKDIEGKLGGSLEDYPGKIALFLDEVQKVPAVFEFIKILADNYKEKFKVLISGSSSLEIQKKGGESLAGRIQYVYLFPLSLGEILKAKVSNFSGSVIKSVVEGDLNLDELKRLQAPLYGYQQHLEVILEKILVWGSLPFIWQKQEPFEKRDYLRSVVNTYLEKDIRGAGLVRELDAFLNLLEVFAFQVGGLLNLAKLSQAVQVSVNTLKNHQSILKNTFVLNQLTPFVKHPAARFVKSPKIYFYDVGVANFLAGRESYKNVLDSKASGGVFENVIIKSFEYFSLNQSRLVRTFFFRDYQGREIDLVISKGEMVIPVEITQASKISSGKISSLSHFISTYTQVEKGIIIYTGELKKIEIKKRPVFCLPWWLWW